MNYLSKKGINSTGHGGGTLLYGRGKVISVDDFRLRKKARRPTSITVVRKDLMLLTSYERERRLSKRVLYIPRGSD